MKKTSRKAETDTEMLARLMAEGFGQINTRFDGIDDRLDGIDDRLDGMGARFDEMHSRLRSLEKGQSEIIVRLGSVERKQEGMRLSIDEMVHKNEFAKLARRVTILEKA